MQSSPPSLPPWQQISHLDLQTEHRLTRIEMTTESHTGVLEAHTEKHERHGKFQSDQETTNKALWLAILGLASGYAHGRMSEVADLALALFKGLRP